VRTSESTRKLWRRIHGGTARIRSATVTHRGGRWLVSFSVEVERNDRAPAQPTSTVGVDLGVKCLAVLSTGEFIANPRHLEKAQRELRRLQRQAARRLGPGVRQSEARSNRWLATQARVARLHNKIANARRDGLHKLTSRLAAAHGVIVVEDLYVAGLLKNRRLARHIAGAGLAELRRQLAYKTTWRGGRLVVVDRWFPSSKTCSGCGAVRIKLRLSERIFRCDQCSLVLDRDLNAARNLAAVSSPSCGATVNEPDGNPRQTSLLAAGTATGRPRLQVWPTSRGNTRLRTAADCLLNGEPSADLLVRADRSDTVAG
jgi:putative transposase